MPFAPRKYAGTLIKGTADFLTASSNTYAQNVQPPTQLPIASANSSGSTNKIYALGKSPIKVNELEKALKNYPKDSELILQGFKNGFHLQYSGPRLPTYSKNLTSLLRNPSAARQQIQKELDLGRIAGPFIQPPLPTLRISPLGLVPKKNGEFRVIHHLSFPENNSVNAFISHEVCTVHYSSIDDAVLMIHRLGKGAKLAKTDIKSAFRLIPVFPGDFDLLGFTLDGLYYFDKCLPFGASISCALFEKFSTFLHWAVQTSNPSDSEPEIIHYLDDFLFGGKADTEQCDVVLQTFRKVCSNLGVPIAEDKTEGPCTRLTFLGIEIDTEEMVLRLPRDKLDELKSQLQNMLTKHKVTLRELQSLIGLLNFACKVVSPGRAFCRRLIDATMGVDKSYYHIRLTKDMKEDLLVWLQFLSAYNGVTLMPPRLWTSAEQLELYTDSAGGNDLGFGIYFGGKWAHGRWPTSWAACEILKDMTFLELFPVLVAVTIWGHLLANTKILFHIDNQATVCVINKKSSKNKNVMKLIRKLVLRSLQLNIQIRAKFLPTYVNIIADAISRCQWTRFRQLAPDAESNPTPIPEEIWWIYGADLRN